MPAALWPPGISTIAGQRPDRARLRQSGCQSGLRVGMSASLIGRLESSAFSTQDQRCASQQIRPRISARWVIFCRAHNEQARQPDPGSRLDGGRSARLKRAKNRPSVPQQLRRFPQAKRPRSPSTLRTGRITATAPAASKSKEL
jgi:hypothetical protein